MYQKNDICYYKIIINDSKLLLEYIIISIIILMNNDYFN